MIPVFLIQIYTKHICQHNFFLKSELSEDCKEP